MIEVCTADLCDAHGDGVTVAEPLFADFGGRRAFGGPIVTVSVFEDNVLVRAALERRVTAGEVLVVDGGRSRRCALLGDRLAAMAVDNGYSGVLIYGCVRDAAALARIPLGIKALGAFPRKSVKRGEGEAGRAVSFAGVRFVPGHFVYADEDGVIVAPRDLLTP